ncbi:MAG: nucleotide exchange factor GrpE [Ruminococcus sp.]|nr:nucleotide exchange factor GrpE [Ruminococcus sp.]
MTQKYSSLSELNKSLSELFELCGVKPRRIRVAPSPKPVTLVENICKDTSVSDFADALSRQTAEAVKRMKERQIDLWCADRESAASEKLESENETLRKQNSELKKRLRAAEEQTNTKDDSAMSFVSEMISLRDSLYSRLEWAQSTLPADDNSVKLLRSQLIESASAMQNLGIDVLEDTDTFDCTYCTIIETVPTDDPNLVDTIAKIFRPGYRYNGEVVRSKEVVMYIKSA